MSKKIILFVALNIFISLNMLAQTNRLTSEQFLNITRRTHPEKTWAVLIGNVTNLRRGHDMISASIKVGMRFTNTRILTKIILKGNGKPETYMVGQPYSGQPASILTEDINKETAPLLGEFGLRPEDLTMTFLYWDFNKEFENDSVKGLDCRVLGLINPETKEYVKVFISTEYYYPLKVEWFKSTPKADEKPYRNVIATAFKTEGKLGSPSKINLYGPGWRSKIDFERISLGFTKDGIPKDIFSNNF